MISIQRFFGRDEKFYDLLEASAEQACESIRALVEMMRQPEQTRAMDTFVQLRRKDKQITEEIGEALCKTFVTPMEREDIEALSNALYKIPKTVGKFTEHYLACPLQDKGKHFTQQAAILDQATAILRTMVKQLRSNPGGLNIIRQEREQLHHLEGEADKLMLERYRELYRYDRNPLDVIMLKDLLELLERVIDRCRDASNVIFHIVLKYS